MRIISYIIFSLLFFYNTAKSQDSLDVTPLGLIVDHEYPYIGGSIGIPGILSVFAGYTKGTAILQGEASALGFGNLTLLQSSLGLIFTKEKDFFASISVAGGYFQDRFERVPLTSWYFGPQVDMNYRFIHLDAGGFYPFSEDVGFLPKINIGVIYRLR
ncbi:MAG: hypothetical protein Kapaf2KO_13560 [Candidatus Kapaibacteriales bacterium]